MCTLYRQTKKCTYFGCTFVGMAREGQQRLNVWLPDDLYTRVEEIGRTTGRTKTELVIRGLELVLEPEPIPEPNIPEPNIPEPNIPDKESSFNPGILTGYQSIIETLEEQLKAKDDGHRERIEDFKEQLRVKDSQLENKDSQLGKQAVHIQSLIQENSRLNIKLLPEYTEKRFKPWWKFW